MIISTEAGDDIVLLVSLEAENDIITSSDEAGNGIKISPKACDGI
jgi:hypothetical protein